MKIFEFLRKNLKKEKGDVKVDMDKNMEYYNHAIESNPYDSDAYIHRGLLKIQNDDKDGAMKDFDRAIGLHPDNALAYNNRGLLKSKMNDFNSAMHISRFCTCIL